MPATAMTSSGGEAGPGTDAAGGAGAVRIVLTAGLVVGVATALLPLWCAGVIAAVILVLLVLLSEIAFGHRPFWSALMVALAGYAFLGKGFAYIGFGGAYVGEVALGLGLSTLLVLGVQRRWQAGSLRAPVEVVTLVAFLGWQAARTVPYLAEYGLTALRDAALWGYAGFAVCIALLVPRRAVDGFLAGYGRMILPFLAWAPVSLAVQKLGVPIPNLPGTSTPVLWPKAGDVGVHLGGIGAFLLTARHPDAGGMRRFSGWLSWALWCVTWLTVAATGRAGALAAVVGVAVAAFLSLSARVLRLAFAAVVVCGVLALTEFRAPFSGGELSWRYVATSVSSILGTQERQGTGPDLEATKRWRLAWWGQIVSYTVQGEHFWLGKGYGINLAVDDGRRGPDATLRSPHNAFMTILARSGVPGLVLWVAFLAALSWRLTTLMLSPGAAPSDRQFAVWALAYLAAFLANASFDVYLEGPMGGIWFWTIVGICIVRTRERGERPGARW